MADHIISLKINGAEEQVSARTVAELLDAKGVDPERRGIAVALNGAVVPRARFSAQGLAGGDSVEIITARQGG